MKQRERNAKARSETASVETDRQAAEQPSKNPNESAADESDVETGDREQMGQADGRNHAAALVGESRPIAEYQRAGHGGRIFREALVQVAAHPGPSLVDRCTPAGHLEHFHRSLPTPARPALAPRPRQRRVRRGISKRRAVSDLRAESH